MRFGVTTARRGWATPDDVINTWAVPDILAFLAKKKNDPRKWLKQARGYAPKSHSRTKPVVEINKERPMRKSEFPRGELFPSEAFVQKCLQAHFLKEGYEIRSEPPTDLVAVHPTRPDVWHVEAKGETADTGLDFRTGLGQLLQRMRDPQRRYGLAVPDIEKFTAQCRQVSGWVRESLKLNWILVRSDGSVRIVGFHESV